MSDAGKSETRPGGSGAVLGAQVVRYSSIFSGGLVVAHLLAFVSTIVLAHLLDPADFGQLALLLFLAGLLNLVFNLGSKQGTMRRVFGGDDDDYDDKKVNKKKDKDDDDDDKKGSKKKKDKDDDDD